MKIDIRPGDTFTIDPDINIAQYRNGKCRFVWNPPTEWVDDPKADTEQDLDRDRAVQIIKWAGHTIEETPATPAPVPWPTHAVVRKSLGYLCAMGTAEQCAQYSTCGDYEVRPLAPAPLSPAMLEFVKAVRENARGVYGREHYLVVAADKLLAEGGGQ